MTENFMRPGYDPDSEHIEIPTLPWSEGFFEDEVRRYARTPNRFASGRLPDAASVDRFAKMFEEHYGEDAPLKEYVGVVWRRDDPSQSRLDPEHTVRVWARGSFTAGRAVEAHFGDEYAKSIWNWEESKRPR